MEWFVVIACGIEKCVECANRSGKDTVECNCCIKGYSIYTNESTSECIPLLEKQTKQLNEMKKEEENKKGDVDLLCECISATCDCICNHAAKQKRAGYFCKYGAISCILICSAHLLDHSVCTRVPCIGFWIDGIITPYIPPSPETVYFAF